MREIKFRTVDKRSGAVEYVTLEELANHDTFELGYDNFDWYEYTGLKDKNGVEIYESDLVRCAQKGQTKTGEIVYRKGGFWWEYEDGSYSWASEAIRKWGGEVIGNKYENR